MRGRRHAGWSSLCLLVACLGQTGQGCIPDTALRRTLLVSAPRAPSRAGASLKHGELIATGELSGSLANHPMSGSEDIIGSLFVSEGDPGLLVPHLQLGGQLYVGLFDVVEIGGGLHYAHVDWTHKNVIGVLDLPGSASVLGVGGGMRVNIPLGDTPAVLSLLADVEIVGLTQASFVCERGPCQTRSDFELDGEEGFKRIQPAAFIQLGGHAMEDLHVALFAGSQSHTRNIGFEADITKRDESSLSSYSVTTLGADVEWRHGALVLGVGGLVPVHGEAKIPNSPQFALRVGLFRPAD